MKHYNKKELKKNNKNKDHHQFNKKNLNIINLLIKNK